MLKTFTVIFILSAFSSSLKLVAQCPATGPSVEYSYGGSLCAGEQNPVNLTVGFSGGFFNVYVSMKVNGQWEQAGTIELNNDVGTAQFYISAPTDFKVDAPPPCSGSTEITVLPPAPAQPSPAFGYGYSCGKGDVHFDLHGASSYNIFLFEPYNNDTYFPVGSTDTGQFDLSPYSPSEKDFYFVSACDDPCPARYSQILISDINLIPPVASAISVCPNAAAIVPASGYSDGYYKWYNSSGQVIDGATFAQLNAGILPSSTYFNVSGTLQKCESDVTKIPVALYAPIDAPASQTLTKCNWEHIILNTGNSFAANWYDHTNTLLNSTPSSYVDLGQLNRIGDYSYSVESISIDGCLSSTRATIALHITDICDDKLNWIESRNLDENGSAFGDSKSYFDDAGKLLQTQTKNFTSQKIFGSQSLRDHLDRVTGSTMAAPIPYADFNYHFYFLLKGVYTPYGAGDFDDPATILNPVPVDHTIPGTVGWYYSPNNNLEKDVPVTDYPYSRTEFYDDGTGEVRRSASAGDQHRLGRGHEMLSGTFPVYSELDDYVSIRRGANQANLRDNLDATLLLNKGVQSVVRDQNGRYAVSITDKSGKTVMAARPGTATENVLTVHNVISSSGDPASPNYRVMTYFYILQPQAVSIIGTTDFIVEDIVTNTRKNPGETFADPNDPEHKWPVGFYRVLLTNSSSAITVSYTHYFLDVSYQFYDDSGRLKSSISPNGLKQFKQGTNYALIDKTTYSYNHQGWLLSMTEPDAGTTSYVYRKDGKIRFSQNAQQNVDGHFSYTNYDALGRPTESGEYIGTALAFAGLSGDILYDKLEGTITNGTDNTLINKKDWIKTYYNSETSFSSIPGFPKIQSDRTLPYTQDFTRGAVASSQNINTQTWYSYDDLGRVTWMIQKPTVLPRTFIVEYTYDFLGNVLSVSNKAFDPTGVLIEQFYHYYEYDADKRLLKAYTSLVPTTSDDQRKLRATYEYYLHGPLKRIVLGDNLQGIDFVYNINGWLTQINHPDKTRDPGHDGQNNGVREDVFGMVLDYYESDLSNLYTAGATSVHDSRSRHHIPFATQEAVAKTHAPLIRFASPFESDTSHEITPFSEYSAQNPMYKKIISESQEHLRQHEKEGKDN